MFGTRAPLTTTCPCQTRQLVYDSVVDLVVVKEALRIA